MRRQKTIVTKSQDYSISIISEDGKETTKTDFIDFGRDNEKVFRFTELSALALERWSIKLNALVEKTSKVKVSADVSDLAKKHSVTAATVALMKEESFSMIDYIDVFNELLYNYEFFDKARNMYISITPNNIGDYIEEINTVGFLREQAMRFLNFFKNGGNTDTTKAIGQ
jgi:hypothetical protein